MLGALKHWFGFIVVDTAEQLLQVSHTIEGLQVTHVTGILVLLVNDYLP